jgi:hypothetical protein
MAVEHFMFRQQFQAAKGSRSKTLELTSSLAVLHKLVVPFCLGRFARELLYFRSLISSGISHQLSLEKKPLACSNIKLQSYMSPLQQIFLICQTVLGA